MYLFLAHVLHWYFEYFLWIWLWVSATEPHWWQFNTGSLPKPILIHIHVAVLLHLPECVKDDLLISLWNELHLNKLGRVRKIKIINNINKLVCKCFVCFFVFAKILETYTPSLCCSALSKSLVDLQFKLNRGHVMMIYGESSAYNWKIFGSGDGLPPVQR